MHRPVSFLVSLIILVFSGCCKKSVLKPLVEMHQERMDHLFVLDLDATGQREIALESASGFGP